MRYTGTLKVTTPSEREIRLTREFDAPRRLIFQALSKPALIRRWWGFQSLVMTVCEVDFRVGGSWRFVLRDPGGQEHPFKGVYKEIVAPERIIQTFVYDVDGIRDHPAIETLTLEEQDGRTVFTSTVLHESKEARDGHLASGMEPGATESYNRLDDLMREIDVAREVQARLLPRTRPPLDTLDYRGRCLQAGGVGGDYYDFLQLEPGIAAFVLGDVAGKGIPAAILMSNLQGSLRSQCAKALDDLPGLLRSVNRLFCESVETERFATLFVGVYDDSTRRFRYESCGHNPPLLVGSDGQVRRLTGTATVLGMVEQWDCSVTETDLRPGDVLVMYSDGVTEALSDAAELYGEARLLEVIRAHREQSAEELLEAIVADVVRFSGRTQSDDLTLIVARGKTTSDEPSR
jgi:serine phosphatase RsbU (regulator of sigma subunit)